MTKRLFIIHGFGANPEKHWFQSLRKSMEKQGFEVSVPYMPTPETPKFNEWLETLDKIVGKIDENTYFVSHSLGTITLLQYLSKYNNLPSFKGFILVSGFDKGIEGFEFLHHFTADKIDYDKIISHAENISVVASENDTIVPLSYSEEVSKKLNANFYTLPNSGHFLDRDGITEFPLLERDFTKNVKLLYSFHFVFKRWDCLISPKKYKNLKF